MEVLTVLNPAMYAVGAEQVIVMLPVVLLKRVMASPSAKVDVGMTMLPPVVSWTYLPTSATARV